MQWWWWWWCQTACPASRVARWGSSEWTLSLERGYQSQRMLVSPPFVTVSPLGDLKVCLTQPASGVMMSCHPEIVPR